MKKFIKTIAAVGGVGAVAAGSTVALTSCGDPSGLYKVDLVPAPDNHWKVMTTDPEINKADQVFASFTINANSNIDYSLITSTNVATTFSCGGILSTKLVAKIELTPGSTKKTVKLSIGSSALVSSDAGVYTFIFATKDATTLPIATHAITFWITNS